MIFDEMPPYPLTLRVFRGKGVIELIVSPPGFANKVLSFEEDVTGDIGPGARSLLQPTTIASRPNILIIVATLRQ